MALPRTHWQRIITTLDPHDDYEAITRIGAAHEFPWDLQQALSLALFRTYAVPSIGNLLHRTQAFEDDTQKRHDDTVLILDAVATHGPESSEGRTAIRRMNQMHGGYDISNDDMRYVLSTFVVTPVRWIRDYGYRELGEDEVVAVVNYYRRLGRLMGIQDIPETYAAFATLMDSYEAEHFAYDVGGRAVADSTLRLLETFYPRPLARGVRLFTLAILDPHVREAFGYRAPPGFVVALSKAALRLRGRIVASLPARSRPKKAAELREVRSYPNGYLLEMLGTFPSPEDLAVGHGSDRESD